MEPITQAPLAPLGPAADTTVQAVFQATARAVEGDRLKQEALQYNQPAGYHRALREYPECQYVRALLAVRRQLSAMAKERRDEAAKVDDRGRGAWQAEQITAAMAQVAQGTMTWLDEVLGRNTAKAPAEETCL